MSDRFPLRPADTWYDPMRTRYGYVVPAIYHLQIRRGLQIHIGDMYAQLHDLDFLRHVDIQGVVTRHAGFNVIDALGLADGEYGAVDALLSTTQERLNVSCEHCGRLLCTECYDDWSRRDD